MDLSSFAKKIQQFQCWNMIVHTNSVLTSLCVHVKCKIRNSFRVRYHTRSYSSLSLPLDDGCPYTLHRVLTMRRGDTMKKNEETNKLEELDIMCRIKFRKQGLENVFC